MLNVDSIRFTAWRNFFVSISRIYVAGGVFGSMHICPFFIKLNNIYLALVAHVDWPCARAIPQSIAQLN